MWSPHVSSIALHVAGTILISGLLSCRFRSAFVKQQVARSQSPLGRLAQSTFSQPNLAVGTPSEDENMSQVLGPPITSKVLAARAFIRYCLDVMHAIQCYAVKALGLNIFSNCSCGLTHVQNITLSQSMSLSQQPVQQPVPPSVRQGSLLPPANQASQHRFTVPVRLFPEPQHPLFLMMQQCNSRIV